MDYCSILKLSCFVNWDYPLKPEDFQEGAALHPLLALCSACNSSTATGKGSFLNSPSQTLPSQSTSNLSLLLHFSSAGELHFSLSPYPTENMANPGSSELPEICELYDSFQPRASCDPIIQCGGSQAAPQPLALVSEQGGTPREPPQSPGQGHPGQEQPSWEMWLGGCWQHLPRPKIC